MVFENFAVERLVDMKKPGWFGDGQNSSVSSDLLLASQALVIKFWEPFTKRKFSFLLVDISKDIPCKIDFCPSFQP